MQMTRTMIHCSQTAIRAAPPRPLARTARTGLGQLLGLLLQVVTRYLLAPRLSRSSVHQGGQKQRQDSATPPEPMPR